MHSKKILIIEDDIGIREAMQIMLEDAGYEVETSVNAQIVQDVDMELFDVLLLDIWLSGVDGRDICRQLKNQERTKRLPIILCSANKNTMKIAYEAGADDFIAKPFEMSELITKIEKVTNH